MIGSPPMPMQVDLAEAEVRKLVDGFVRQRAERETTPSGRACEMWPGMMPILHLPGVMMPGQFGPISRVVGQRRGSVITFTMSRTGMPSVMQTTSGDPRVGRFHDRVGGERRRHEDHARVGAGLRDRVGDGVEHGEALVRRARPCPGVTPPTMCRAVSRAAAGVERAFVAGQALNDQPRVTCRGGWT